MNTKSLRVFRNFIVSASLLMIMLGGQSAFAQETRGTIRGTITDPNGNAVPNAAVQVIDPSRGNKVNLTTNSDGFFQANYLFPGTYQVIVEAPGFKKSIRYPVRGWRCTGNGQCNCRGAPA
jgi:hypothetical protein